MRKAASLISTLILCGLAGPASAEPVPKGHEAFLDRIEASIAPVQARRGETIILRVHLDLKDGARLYPTQDSDSEMGQSLTPFLVKGPDTAVVVRVSAWREPTYRAVVDPAIGSYRVVEGRATWERRIVISPEATPGERRIAVKVTGQIVNDRM